MSSRRRPVRTIGLRSLALVIGVAFALTGCGGDGDDPSVSAGGEATTTTPAESTTPTTTTPTTTTIEDTSAASVPPGFRAIEYGGLQFAVPDDWPVYDLAQEPTRCVRFDQHAVYLGHAGPNQDCPAQLIGRTEAIQIEPLDDVSATAAARATEPNATTGGVPVRVNPDRDVTRSVIAVFDDAGVVVTLTFADDDALAEQILQMVGPSTP